MPAEPYGPVARASGLGARLSLRRGSGAFWGCRPSVPSTGTELGTGAVGWCAVLPRLSCARLGRCHPARLRCPGLSLGAGGGRMCEGLLSVERAVCTWGPSPWGCPMLLLTLAFA